MNSSEIQGDQLETKDENHSNLNAILYIDKTTDNDLIQFINQAQQRGFNCLDLSKRNIKDFPNQLLKFSSLQYLYLEGNELTELPNEIFLRLTNLKWLDVRHNQLTTIPSNGLDKHRCLQYLLLSGNRLRTLPSELGKVKTLSVLNLDGNPLDQIPFDIIRQGVKSIQEYLRKKYKSDHDLLSSSSSSSSEDDNDRRQTPKLASNTRSFIYPRKSKSETSYYETTQSNFLPSHLQSCLQFKKVTCTTLRPSSSVRVRPRSELRMMSAVRTNSMVKKPNDLIKPVYPLREPSLMHLKHREITAKKPIEPLNPQSFITYYDYEEPLIQTSFHIDEHYMPIIKKNEHQRDHRPEQDEERRKHDREIHARIRQITDQMLKRRLQTQSNAFEEKHQIQLELRELRRLQTETEKKQRIIRLKSHKKL